MKKTYLTDKEKKNVLVVDNEGNILYKEINEELFVSGCKLFIKEDLKTQLNDTEEISYFELLNLLIKKG